MGGEGCHLASGVAVAPGNQSLCLALNASTLSPGQTPCGPNLETQEYKLASGATQYGTRTLNIEDGCICFGSNTLYQTMGTSNYTRWR